MVAYLEQFTQDLVRRLQTREIGGIGRRFAVLIEELNRLDPRDFAAAVQLEFLETRLLVRQLDTSPSGVLENRAMKLRETEFMRSLILGYQKEFEETKVVPGGHSRKSPEEYRDHLVGELNTNQKTMQEYQAPIDDAAGVCRRVVEVLRCYAGRGSQGVTRSFAFIHRVDLRAIVERDYRELCLCLLPSLAWKSAVVMAGSILEAILYDLLTCEPARISAAMAAPRAARKGTNGPVKDITSDDYREEWPLASLIDVAADLNLISKQRENAIDQVLRDYRNFVHPRKEVRTAHPCTEAEATLAKGALDAVCNHLSGP